MLAVEALKKGDARRAQREIDAARLWPENLGAGKPYPADVDERLEDFLAAQCLARSGEDAESTELLQKVTAFEGRDRGSSDPRARAGPEADGPRGRGAEAPHRLVDPRARERARRLGVRAYDGQVARCRRARARTRGCWRPGWPPRP